MHDFSCPRTPQQNGVVERKNKTLQEMARNMINETNVAKIFWAEAINTACYIQNRISIRPILEKTPPYPSKRHDRSVAICNVGH